MWMRTRRGICLPRVSPGWWLNGKPPWIFLVVNSGNLHRWSVIEGGSNALDWNANLEYGIPTSSKLQLSVYLVFLPQGLERVI